MSSGHADAGLGAVRNAAGYAGLALLGAVVLGSALSWVGPLVLAVLVPALGMTADGTPAWWAWPIHPVSSSGAWAWSLTLTAVGVVAHTVRAPRVVPASDPLEN